MIRRLVMTVLFLISTTPLGLAAQDAMPLSLKQCIELALKNNVDVLVSRARAEEAQGEHIVLDADLLPQIDAVASQERTWWENIGALGFSGFGTIGPFNTFSANIMVSQRILDFSALAHAQAGRIKAKASELDIALASQQVILATSQAYIQALGYQKELDTSYEDIRLADHFLSLSSHQMDVGLASKVDVAGNRTQLAQESAHQEELRLNVERSLLELKRLIKIPLSQPIKLTDTLKPNAYSYMEADQAVAHALHDRLEVQISNADSHYSRTELGAARSEYLPKVNLSGEWGGLGITPDRDVVHNANAMLSVSLPVWEGGRINGDIKQKRGLDEEQKARQDDLNWKIEEDVRLSLQTLISTRAQMDAVQKVEDYAQQELDLAQDRFTAGLGNNIQLIHAQVALADARDKYVQTLALYNQAQLNYFGALGTPQEFDLSNTERKS